MDTSLLREAILPPKIDDGPGVICGSLLGVLEALPSVVVVLRGDDLGAAAVGDEAGREREADAVGEAAERADDDGLDFPPPPPLLAPPKRASRLEAWSRL